MKNTYNVDIDRNNNFDLIRLLSALQVVLNHSIDHLILQNDLSIMLSAISFFPGVIVFFVISGFLITRSYYRCMNRNLDNPKQNVYQYFKNRFLRIFPALWFGFLLLLIILLSFKVIDVRDLLRKDIALWMIGQISIFQYYTPDILRGFGVGTPNGSLWTIPVELEFYLVLPIIFLIRKKWSLNKKFIILFVISIFFNIIWVKLDTSSIIDKLIGVSVFPYLYSFLFGGLMFLNWGKIRRFLENRFLFWILLYIIYCFVLNSTPSYKKLF